MKSANDTPILSPHWQPASSDIKLEDHSIDIWRLHLDRVETDSTLLSQDEREKTAGLISIELQQRYMAVRCGLRLILSHYLPLSAEQLEFRKKANGKPYLDSGLCFNISHSGKLALIAITESNEIGIDLEPIKPRANMVRIAQRVFQSEDIELIMNASTEVDRIDLFTLAWTRLEARQKMTGNGLFGDKATPPHQLFHFTPRDNWMATVAIADSDQTIKLRFLDFENE